MKIELRRAAMTYQAPDGEVAALQDVTFGVADGEFVSIVGPSGCGKSTLLALIAGIEHPSGGEVLVDGEPVRAPTGKAGLMPQRDQLFDWRTIWGNVTLGLEVRHENTPARREGVHDLLEQYQLAGFARKLPNQLSGGMRQRCALIRTLATSPDVLLLDEPFSALDYQTRLAVSGDISQIIRREHKTALLVTHDISEAISLSDRIVVLSHRPATVKAIHDLGALRTVPPLERRMTRRAHHMNISLEIESMEKLGSVVGHLHAQGARIFDFEVNRSGSAALPNFLCQFSAVLPDRRDHPELLAELSALDGVILIEEI